jgi:copper chaperone CopZ
MRYQMDVSVQLSIAGMTRSGCAKAVTRALSQVPDVPEVAVDRDAGQARIKGRVSPQVLVAAWEQGGFGAGSAQDREVE